MNAVHRETFEPASWLLVFNHEASTRWRSFLAFGRFKHVWACTYMPDQRAWLVYDVHLDGTTMGLVPDGKPFLEFFGRQTQGMRKATLLRMPVHRYRNCIKWTGFTNRLGFWCVPAIKHLIGLRSSALRPDSLYRQCLRHGALPFEATDAGSTVQAVAA